MNQDYDSLIKDYSKLSKSGTEKQKSLEILKKREEKRKIQFDTIHLKHKKEVVSLRLDTEILAAFRAKGRFWQTTLNDFLRAAVDEHRV